MSRHCTTCTCGEVTVTFDTYTRTWSHPELAPRCTSCDHPIAGAMYLSNRGVYHDTRECRP